MQVDTTREDLLRSARSVLMLEGVARTPIDLALDLRARGWTVDAGHLEDLMTRAEAVFLRVGDGFVALPETAEPPSTPTITREQLHDRLARKLAAPWWRVLALQSAYPPLPQAPLSDLARRLDEDRRGRVFRVAKVYDRHCWLVAWIDGVTLTRRENLRQWACWEIDDLPSWQPSRDPVQPRYQALPAHRLALVRPAPDAAGMAELLLEELTATGARPQDVWIEPVPADGTEVDNRERRLAESRSTLTATPVPGRHAAPPVCRSCQEPLTAVEDVARGEHGPCWATHEPAHSEVVRHTRREWVGAIDRSAWAAMVAAPPRGGAPGLSRGRVGSATSRP